MIFNNFRSKLTLTSFILSAILTTMSLSQQAYAKTDTTFAVEFNVNLSKAVVQHTFDPDSDLVYVVMNTRTQILQLVPGTDYLYSGTLPDGLDSGTVYQYKYRINDTIWEDVNRNFIAKQGTVTLSDWWNDDPVNRTTFLVNMYFAKYYGMFDPDVDSVCIVGTMNNMQGSPKMSRVDTTLIYSYTYTLDPGSVHQFKYRINADSSGLELLNKPARMVRVPDTLLQVSNDFNNFNPAKRLITFNCNMGYYITAHHFDPAFQYLDIAGNFNGMSANDVLFDADGDSVYTLESYPDTSWFSQGPLEFKFRINGDWNLAELTGQPARAYVFHDTINQNPNVYNCFYNNLDPAVPTPPWVYNVSIQGLLIYKKILSGSYSYENVNGIAEGLSTYRWLRSDNAQGIGAIPIDSAWKITYVVDTLDIGKWLVFEVTPKALSGDSAVGKPVQVISTNSISAWDVGMEEYTPLSVRVYPNPASNALTIATDCEADYFEITNSIGQVVMVRNHPELQTFTLQIGHLPAGFYLLKVKTKNGRTGIARIMKL